MIMPNKPWTKKYEPNSFDELELQNNVIVRLRNYIDTFKAKKSKPLLFYGPPGTGKTAAAHVLTNEYGYELVEVNASDFRSKVNFDAIVGNATKQMSLFFKSKLILIDEVDGMSGSGDRGALSEIIKLAKECPYPIILTANDPWDRSFSKLRTASTLILFDKIDSKVISSVLKKICIAENIEYRDDDIRLLAIRAGGDMRGAIIDLQTLVTRDRKFDVKSLQELYGRMQKQSMMNGLALLYRTTDPKISSKAFDFVDSDPNTTFNWIEENTAYAYEDDIPALNYAYDYLSYADIFSKRIMKDQYWRLLVYINALSTIGVSIAKTKPYNKFFTFKETTRFLKLWMAKNKNAAKLSFAKTVSEKTHASVKDVYNDLYLYKYILSGTYNKNLFLKEFDMAKDDIEFIFS